MSLDIAAARTLIRDALLARNQYKLDAACLAVHHDLGPATMVAIVNLETGTLPADVIAYWLAPCTQPGCEPGHVHD